ncbi:MAG: hypothetical protein LUH22_11345 [Bacteroides sp.]|nr:hypothetical protein [Bacteroides sp.]
MKKDGLLFLLSILVLFSCSDNDPVSDGDGVYEDHFYPNCFTSPEAMD